MSANADKCDLMFSGRIGSCTVLFSNARQDNPITPPPPMKPNDISPQAIAAICALPAIMAFCPTLSAQEIEIGTGTGAEQSVTFAFTETYSEANLKPRDEDGKIISGDTVFENEWFTAKYNSNDDLLEESENYEYSEKQVTVKISNKEFLEGLVEASFLPGPVTGWALKFVTSGEEPDSVSGRFYAVKSGVAPVDLSELIGAYEDGAAYSGSAKWSSKTTYKYTSGSEPSETVKEIWSISGKRMTNLQLEFSFSDGYADIDGIFNESWSLKSFGTGENQYWQFAPGAAKLDNASGTSRSVEGDLFVDEWDYESVIKGTMSLAAGKLFPNINEPYPDFEPNSEDPE